jgi:hypothetical protein
MENVDSRMIEIRGQRVRVAQASHERWWSVSQGGEYFEFRPDGAGGWLLSQSAEWDCHDPAHVVGRGMTLQAAAEDFSHTVTRRTSPRPDAPRATRRRDLAIASIEDLVSALGAATRLGYDDGRAGSAVRTGNATPRGSSPARTSSWRANAPAARSRGSRRTSPMRARAGSCSRAWATSTTTSSS